MDSDEKLKNYIRELVKKELSEISTTANVAGYLTPKAFAGDGQSNSQSVKAMAKRIGYTLTKRGEEDVRRGDRLQESATGEAAGQLIKNAFRDNTESNEISSPMTEEEFANHMAKIASYEGVVKKINENYYAYRNDETRKPHQKIGQAISEINKQLKLVERALKINHRLQKEQGVPSDRLWKRTQNQMTKLEGKLIELAGKIREMRS
jgi:hypothetical protein